MYMLKLILIDINSRRPLRHLFAPAVSLLLAGALPAGCARMSSAPALVEVHRERAGGIDVVLLAPQAALKQTRNYCTVEFRKGNQLVDAGTVQVRTSMTMEGVPMGGVVTEPKRIAAGRFTVEMVLAMTGHWQITIDWDGPAGKGSVTFPADVAS
jgi:YtkA-like protein